MDWMTSGPKYSEIPQDEETSFPFKDFRQFYHQIFPPLRTAHWDRPLEH